jgi:hypothetical protein
MVAYHLNRNSGNFGWNANGRKIFGRPPRKITVINGLLKRALRGSGEGDLGQWGEGTGGSGPPYQTHDFSRISGIHNYGHNITFFYVGVQRSQCVFPY